MSPQYRERHESIADLLQQIERFPLKGTALLASTIQTGRRKNRLKRNGEKLKHHFRGFSEKLFGLLGTSTH